MSQKKADAWAKKIKAIRAEWAERITQMEEKIASELEPFFDGIRTMGASSSNFKLFRQAYSHFVEKRKHKSKTIFPMFEAWRAQRLSETLSDTAYSLFLYLGLVESLGNTLADILVMLLIANEKDFHIECLHTVPRIKHAVSIKDLEKERVPLTMKLNFLRDNGLAEFASVVDSKLRNAIAHLDFEIRKDEIRIKGKKARILILLNLDMLLAALIKTTMLLEHFAQERGLASERSDIHA